MEPSFGKLWVPIGDGHGGFDYSRAPMRVIMSGRRQGSERNNDAQQFASLPPRMRAHVAHYLGEVAVTVADARASHAPRQKVMINYFKGITNTKPGFVFYFAVNPTNQSILEAMGAYDRLVSYWELRGM